MKPTLEKINTANRLCHRGRIWPALLVLSAWSASSALSADEMPNACPVDGCEVRVVEVKPSGDELELTFKSNFSPDVSKNHLHVWWGELYTVKQVGRNAEPEFKVKQGRWHRHDDYPTYITQGAASTGVRAGAVTMCVTAADRDHNVLDANIYNCVDVSDKL